MLGIHKLNTDISYLLMCAPESTEFIIILIPVFQQYQVCRQKLESKCDALRILSHDLDQCRQQRDQFKLMAEQVQQRYQSLKRQLAGVVRTSSHSSSFVNKSFILAFIRPGIHATLMIVLHYIIPILGVIVIEV